MTEIEVRWMDRDDNGPIVRVRWKPESGEMFAVNVPVDGDWSPPADPEKDVPKTDQLWTAAVQAAQDVARRFTELEV